MKTLPTILFMLLLAACSSSDNNSQDAEGSVIADIDGVRWIATSQQNAVHVLSNFELNGKKDADQSTISLHLTGVSGPGIYELKDGNFAQIVRESENEVYATNNLHNGTLTITSLTDNRAQGSFSFDAEQVLSTTPAIISVRDGAFDVPVLK